MNVYANVKECVYRMCLQSISCHALASLDMEPYCTARSLLVPCEAHWRLKGSSLINPVYPKKQYHVVYMND